jgi:hypothetical protein
MKFLVCLFVTALCGAVAAADYADGKLGQALILDGSSHTVKIPHYARLKPDKAITISAWIKPERVGIKQGQHLVYEKDRTPLCNLHVTQMQSMGLERDHFVDGTGRLTGLS